MLDKGMDSKRRMYARDEDFKPFKGQSMAMIFTKPSARTRVSFETVRGREEREGCVWGGRGTSEMMGRVGGEGGPPRQWESPSLNCRPSR